MKLAGEQLVLDTNILVHWLRGKEFGAKLHADYALGARSPRPIVPLVVKAEIKSLAYQFNWGTTGTERSTSFCGRCQLRKSHLNL